MPTCGSYCMNKNCDGQRIKDLALTMSGPPASGDDKVSKEKQSRDAIDRLYGYLDLLDRKGNSLVTANSFMIAIVGLLLFRPTGAFEPHPAGTNAWQSMSPLHELALVSGIIATLFSLIALAVALNVFQIQWRFMQFAGRGSLLSFDPELERLAHAAARRCDAIMSIRVLTLLALAFTAIGIAFSYMGLVQ